MTIKPWIVFAPLSLVLFLGGCATKAPELSPLPVGLPYQERQAPTDERLSLRLSYPQVASDLQRLQSTVTVQRDFVLPEGASLVVGGRVDAVEGAQTAVGWGSAGQRFQTTSYFSIVEQQIEVHLLRQGFTVVSYNFV